MSCHGSVTQSEGRFDFLFRAQYAGNFIFRVHCWRLRFWKSCLSLITQSPVQEKSRIDLAAMSERECFQKEQEVSQKEPMSAKPCAKSSVNKDSFDEKDHSSKALRHRPYPIDAATCTASVKAKRRRPYPIDAATCAKPVIIDAEESTVEVPFWPPCFMGTSSFTSKELIFLHVI